MHQRKCALLAVLVCTSALCSPLARGAGGSGFFETFPGTTLDTNTWETYPPGAINISQNNGLFLSTLSGYPLGDYTTKSVTMGVGDTLRAAVRMDAVDYGFSGAVYVLLTTNTAGNQFSSINDSRYFGIYNYYGGVSTTAGSAGNGYGFLMLNTPQPNGVIRYWDIERLSSSSVAFRVRDENLALLASFTENNLGSVMGLSNFPDNMFISLYAQSADAFIKSVQIVPEPVTAGCTGLTIFGLTTLRRRRAL